MVVNETARILTAPTGITDIFNWAGNIFIPWFVYLVTQLIIPRMQDLLFSPLQQTEMLWVVVPLLMTILLMTFYFGAHKDEELGWNTAFGNSMVLIFTSINLLQRIYGNISFSHLIFNEDTIIALALMAEGFLLMFINFFHFLPKKVAFYVSSPLHINIIALFGAIVVYSTKISADYVTIISIIILYIICGAILNLVKKLIPGAKEGIERMTESSYLRLEKIQENR
ncbi:MAG: hypothetical protein EPN86_06120 [Nanoarchaeota archaeon]|nr:MAG: hypothetical protein EPN86_06120 [Nanoarchaeota archaeon]